MNQSGQQQTLTSMLMEAVKAAASSKQLVSETQPTQNNSLTNSTQQTFSEQSPTIHTLNTNSMFTSGGMTSVLGSNTAMCGGDSGSTTRDDFMMDSNLVMQMMKMEMANDNANNQQSMVSTSTTLNNQGNQFLNESDTSLDSTMLTMLMNTTVNNTTMSQLNQLFSHFLLNNTTNVQDSIALPTPHYENTTNNSGNSRSENKKLNNTCMSPTNFGELVNSPQFFDNGCSTHVFIKKGSSKRRNSNSQPEQSWFRLLVQHQVSPSREDDTRREGSYSNHTKVVHTNRCMICVDCYYYVLIVLPNKLYSLSDLEFQLEEDAPEGKKKKKSTNSPPIEIKIRGKDLTSSTKLKHSNQSPSSSASNCESSNMIAIFEIMVNRKRAKSKSDSPCNIQLNCKNEKLIKMTIDESGSSDNSDLEILDLAQQEICNSNVQKKRKKESLLFDDNESDFIDYTHVDSNRKRSKSNATKNQCDKTPFDHLKQWIIVTVFHESISVDLTKFPNFSFPKELSLNETFLLYVDVPTQLSEFHDICFKILDAESKQELSFNGEKWIDTNVINCCNFNIQSSLVSLHVEYSISFRDINHDGLLVFVVALKDKNNEEERIIYNGSPFKIRKQIDSMDELGISTIQCSGFESLEVEPATISEIFDEIPILNSENLFSEVNSPTMSLNFVPPSESDILDDFERFLDM